MPAAMRWRDAAWGRPKPAAAQNKARSGKPVISAPIGLIVGACRLRSRLLERNPELIPGTPHDAAGPPRASTIEGELEGVGHALGGGERQARAAAGQVLQRALHLGGGAGGPVAHQDLSVAPDARAGDRPALIHGASP